MRALLLLLAALFALALPTSRAQAATCEAQMSDIAFGSVSLRAGAVNRTSGTLSIECTNALVSVVGVCIRFGPGSAGAGPGNAPRYLRNGSGDALAYNLSAGGYGALYGTLNEVFVEVPIVLGRGRVTVPIYAEILSTGTEFDTGLYESVYSGATHIEMSYGLLSCDLFGTSQSVPDFRVSAETVASCELDVGSMNFGQVSGLASRPADAEAAIDIRCTAGTSYTVSLGMGETPGVTDPTARRMRSLTHSLVYGLYHDFGRSMPWGEAPSQRAQGAGSGYGQRYMVYGRIHAGQQTAIGVYTDSVVVTVHY